MKSKDTKQRLFEVMGKLDKTFKPKLNEDINPVENKNEFTLISTENEPVHFELDNYRNNGALAVELVTAEGESWAMVSVNLPESDKLPKDEFFLKDWTENEKIAKELIIKKIIVPTGKQASMGARSYKINPESPNLNETGEWSGDEDDVAWMEALKNEIEEISSATNGKLRLIDVQGFDKYQGPYAIVSIDGKKYKVWTMEEQGQLWIEDYPVDNTSGEGTKAGFAGNASEIIRMLGKNPADMVTSKDFNYSLNEDNDFQELQRKIHSGEVWLDYYAPSDSEEYTDGQTFYNKSGQQLRDPEEYNPYSDGYTPFGDEG
jgi:hypothetical protein